MTFVFSSLQAVIVTKGTITTASFKTLCNFYFSHCQKILRETRNRQIHKSWNLTIIWDMSWSLFILLSEEPFGISTSIKWFLLESVLLWEPAFKKASSKKQAISFLVFDHIDFWGGVQLAGGKSEYFLHTEKEMGSLGSKNQCFDSTFFLGVTSTFREAWTFTIFFCSVQMVPSISAQGFR